MNSRITVRGSFPLLSGILILPAGVIVLLDMMGFTSESWAHLINPVIVPVALLMVPLGLRVGGASIRLPAILAFLTVLPFMILEVVNRRGYGEAFPFPLFTLLWLFSLMFMQLLLPIVRGVRARDNILANPVLLFVRVAFLVALAWVWGAWVVDQIPCFLGIPACD